MSIALGCNVYNDAAALRGLLEVSSRYFDNMFFVHSGPGGAMSTDGTIELIQQYGGTIVFDDIQKGFGHVRSRLLHECGCEWCFIMDADERFYPLLNILECHGEKEWKGPSDPTEPEFTVTVNKNVIDQGGHVKHQIQNPELMAMRSTRRHWMDFSMRKPTQNWQRNRDHQLRIVRNHPDIRYVTNVVMHERLIDTRTGKDPHFLMQDDYGGPFHDHFHMAFRRAHPGSKEWNEQQYARLSRGEPMEIR